MVLNKRLYIIGNGFDLHHTIKSSYWHFRDYVKANDRALFEALEKYFIADELWSDFEETLQYLDTDSIVDEASNFLESYSAENWSDAFHHDYQYEIQQKINVITEQLKKRFTEWVVQLSIPSSSDIQLLDLKTDCLFVTFNYTRTLEMLYGVSDKKILYIHNKAVDAESDLILGHSRKPSEEDSFNKGNNEDQDVRVTEGNQILDQYFVDTYKSTETIIQENKTFFDSLNDLKEIYVLGHSLSAVDIPYFEEIIKSIKVKEVVWKVSYHSEPDKVKYRNILINLGIQENLIQIDKMVVLNDPNANQFKLEL